MTIETTLEVIPEGTNSQNLYSDEIARTRVMTVRATRAGKDYNFTASHRTNQEGYIPFDEFAGALSRSRRLAKSMFNHSGRTQANLDIFQITYKTKSPGYSQ